MKKCRPREAPETLRGASWASKCAPRELPGRPETVQMRSQEVQNAPKMTYGRSMSVLSAQKLLKDVQDIHFCVLEASTIIKKRWKNEGFLKFQLFWFWSVLDLHFGAFGHHLEAFWGVREAFREPKWHQKWPRRHPKWGPKRGMETEGQFWRKSCSRSSHLRILRNLSWKGTRSAMNLW